MNRIKKIILYGLGGLTALAFIPLFAAFEAHVINVTAQIENSLFVHPQSRQFGTVFPQEYKEQGIFVTFSESFSAAEQTRVGNIDYQIVQKPKPRPEYESQAGKDAARLWCHNNYPQSPFDPNDPVWISYLANCYPLLCPYLSKTPDNFPLPGNDIGVPAFHDPFAVSSIAKGTINKFGADVGDNWVIDLDVPCFKGQCAQDWTHQGWELPPQLEHQVFGCDLWVEVAKIY